MMNPMFIDRNMFRDYGLVAVIKTTGVQLLEPLQETVVEVKVDGLRNEMIRMETIIKKHIKAA